METKYLKINPTVLLSGLIAALPKILPSRMSILFFAIVVIGYVKEFPP